MAAVQPEPWLRALITTTTNNNNNQTLSYFMSLLNFKDKKALQWGCLPSEAASFFFC
jgi:hypothetical protein